MGKQKAAMVFLYKSVNLLPSSLHLNSLLLRFNYMLMGNLKLCLCLVLIFVLFSNSEARSLSSSTSTNTNQQMMKTAKQVLKASIQRHAGMHFVSKRSSPGGPDPHHH